MKRRIIVATLFTVVCALLISSVVGILLFRNQELNASRRTLYEMLILMDAQSAITDPTAISSQFAQVGSNKRLTIIDTDGSVLADTYTDISELDNHISRPEVEEARASGWGESIRYSATFKTNMLYIAKRFADGMVGRAAMPLYSINTLALSSVWGFLPAAVAGLLLALFLARRTANKVLAPLNAVGSALQSVLDGTQQPGLDGYEDDEELRPILRYIDQLVERLGSYISSVTAERNKVSLVLDCMDEGLLLLDEADRVLAVNRAARVLLNIPEDEADGALLTHTPRLREAVAESRKQQTAVVLDTDAPAGQPHCLRMFISPVSGRQYEGESVGTSILISDVTRLKKAEGIRAEFTANVSHELKTPLTSIKGFADMFSNGIVADPEAQKRFATLIGVEVDRLINLINDILNLSELESAAIPQGDERTNALTAARDAADLLAIPALSRKISLHIAGEDAVVSIPQSRLRELLLNLMENGIKYNEPGGMVDVSVTISEQWGLITVSDTGIGIPLQAQDRVFERFYRVDKGRSRKNGGTGLGLAIVKHIVQLYGGSIRLESELGKGSTFTIALPLSNCPRKIP